jgi:hypothetical protein
LKSSLQAAEACGLEQTVKPARAKVVACLLRQTPLIVGARGAFAEERRQRMRAGDHNGVTIRPRSARLDGNLSKGTRHGKSSARLSNTLKRSI